MQISSSHRITALILAFLVLLTSVSIGIDMHFCQGQLKSISLLGKAKQCHDVKKACPFHPKQDNAKKTNDCCSNKEIVIEKFDEDATLDISLQEVTSSIAILSTTIELPKEPIAKTSYTKYLHYKPPIPEKDRRVLFQTFLI